MSSIMSSTSTSSFSPSIAEEMAFLAAVNKANAALLEGLTHKLRDDDLSMDEKERQIRKHLGIYMMVQEHALITLECAELAGEEADGESEGGLGNVEGGGDWFCVEDDDEGEASTNGSSIDDREAMSTELIITRTTAKPGLFATSLMQQKLTEKGGRVQDWLRRIENGSMKRSRPISLDDSPCKRRMHV
jgi:hypothetical protein